MKNQVFLQTVALFAAVASTLAQDANQHRPRGNAASGEAFFRVDFPNVHGNDRSCATCHVPEESFQLTPHHVETRYQALQERRLTEPGADDPLFRSIDANDGVDDFTNL